MKLYHNPRCSKSRQALALLQEKNIEVDIKLYLKDGFILFTPALSKEEILWINRHSVISNMPKPIAEEEF